MGLRGKAAASDARLLSIAFDAVTQLNSKTLPRLRLGKNTVCVAAGEQIRIHRALAGSLQAQLQDVRGRGEERCCSRSSAVIWPRCVPRRAAKKPTWSFASTAPSDITSVTYGGRFYNRGAQAQIDQLHSFDGGKTWACSYSLTDTTSPWDVIHYEKIENIPAGTKSVLFKYRWNAANAGPDVCGLYAVRMEATHRPASEERKPMEVTFTWNERQEDYTTIQRSHTQLVETLPCTYEINVGGADHPVMESLRINLKNEPTSGAPPVEYGYSDGQDIPDAPKFQDRWVTYGKNLAEGKPYTCTAPSRDNWGAGDPDGKILTDGIVGPPYTGGTAYRYGAMWNKGDSAGGNRRPGPG